LIGLRSTLCGSSSSKKLMVLSFSVILSSARSAVFPAAAFRMKIDWITGRWKKAPEGAVG
jgi:hypothetical protein